MPPCHGGGREFESRPDRKGPGYPGFFMESYFVYIIRSDKDQTFYIGYTTDISRRLEEHNQGKSNYTSHKIPWKLVYLETFYSKSDALKREKFLKNQKNIQFYEKLINRE